MGNKAGVDMDIRQLGEAPTEELDSGTDSMSVSETSATSTDSTTNSGKDKKRFGSGRLLRWRGGTKKQAALKGELKIVILGIAASGKSTFVRQVRTIHNNLYTQAELQNYYHIICTNIWDGMKEVCIHMKKHNIDCEIPENAKRTRYFRELPAEAPPLTAREVDRIKALWADPAVAKCVEVMKSEDLAIHNFTYFMERIDVIAEKEYVPSNKDVLFARQRSTGACEVSIVHNKVRYTLVDMGGQKPERAKWDRALDLGVNGIFFFCSVEEFDIESAEEKGKTKLEISYNTWKSLFDNEKVISQLEIFLVFNKIDLLESKLLKNFRNFKKFYPDYKGVLEFLEQRFFDAIPDFYTKPLTCLRCCALDPELVGDVFDYADQYMAKKILTKPSK